MLRFLSIRHLAVIDRLELEFEPGLNVLTGETGAGKSILVGAVGLLVGGRASADLVRTGEETAAVEAIFETPAGAEMIVRREVSAQGRSRAFIDGALATSARAARLVRRALVDLHGQHEHQVLLDPGAHLDLLDEFAGAAPERAAVAAAFAALAGRSRANAIGCSPAEREKASRAEFIAFQLAEIDRVAPKPGEDDELAPTRQVLANADKLQRLCAEAYDALYEGDQAALPALGARLEARRRACRARRAVRAATSTRATAVKSQLEDLAFFLRSYAAGHRRRRRRACRRSRTGSPLLERLKKKHGPTLDDVDRAKRTRSAATSTISSTATERAAELDRALEQSARKRIVTAAARCRRRRAGRRDRRSRGARDVARRSRDGAGRGARSVFGRRAGRSAVDRARRRAGRVLHLAESRRGPAGRWRASPRAASCRGSCSR